MTTGAALRQARERAGISLSALAAATHFTVGYLSNIEAGRRRATPEVVAAYERIIANFADPSELVRRIAVSDVSVETLDQVEAAVDGLAIDYARQPAHVLLPRVHELLAQIGRLLDGRKTLAQHRRLLRAGGWLTLLGGTCEIDLQRPGGGTRYLHAAEQLANHADDSELGAWAVETRAFKALFAGRFQDAVLLSQRAQALAPKGSSAFIQATAQEGRAWARMGRAAETRQVLDRTHRLVSALPVPDQPEHHYRYDPSKALAYTATTLAWVGDLSAEEFARDAVRAFDGARPRRQAIARADLGLALVAANKPDEAIAVTLESVASGLLSVSNRVRVREVLAGVAGTGLREVDELREAYETFLG